MRKTLPRPPEPRPDHPSQSLLVQGQGLTRHFELDGQRVTALHETSVTVCPGDRIALLGASGSGKSTLLHLLGGLDQPSSGTLTWPALGPAQHLRPGHVAFVFQAQSLMPPLTALENIALPLILLGQDTAEAEREARVWLDRLALSALADQLPDELSGGQAQRVAVARALVTHPKLVLADEPTGQLDSVTAQHLMDALLCALDADAALVMATHDSGVAQRLSDIWHMQDGRLTMITAARGGIQ